jgi:hypothetical protein
VQNSEIQSSPKNESSPETIQSNTVPKDLTGINSKESSSTSENIIGAAGMTMNESKNNFKPCFQEENYCLLHQEYLKICFPFESFPVSH